MKLSDMQKVKELADARAYALDRLNNLEDETLGACWVDLLLGSEGGKKYQARFVPEPAAVDFVTGPISPAAVASIRTILIAEAKRDVATIEGILKTLGVEV